MNTKMRYLTGVLASAALFAASGDALAQGVIATGNFCIPDGSGKDGGFKDADFELTGKLKGNGNGKVLADGRYQLTDVTSNNGQTATFYYSEPLNFRYTDIANKTTRQFHAFFSFSMGGTMDGAAGSGLAFLVQNNESSKSGSSGDGLGYGGTTKSFQFEFDTHQDTPSAGTAVFPDPVDDHIGFMLDGKQYEHPASYLPKNGANPIQFNSAAAPYKRFYVWIDYEGGTGPDAKKMKLYFQSDGTKVKPAAPIPWKQTKDFVGFDPLDPNFPSTSFDPDYWLSIDAVNQPGQGWVGFSGSTYGASLKNDHFIHEFEVSNEGIPCACQVGMGLDPCGTATGTTACSAGAMTKGTGICVECTEGDFDACTGNTPVCDKEKEVCVECNTNTDCSKNMANPHCDTTSHTCVPCAADDDCKGFPATPVCANPGTATATCVECKVADDCKGTPATPVCAGTTNTCEECDKNLDCQTGKPVCTQATHICDPCKTDADCDGRPLTPACALTGKQVGECVECTENKHCPSDTPSCDAANYECEGCKSDLECTFVDPVCNVTAGTCGDCSEDAQCNRFPEKPSCHLETGALKGQCGPKVVSTDVIEGGGFSCAAAGSSTSDGIFAGLMAAAGVAAAMGRRRRRAS